MSEYNSSVRRAFRVRLVFGAWTKGSVRFVSSRFKIPRFRNTRSIVRFIFKNKFHPLGTKRNGGGLRRRLKNSWIKHVSHHTLPPQLSKSLTRSKWHFVFIVLWDINMFCALYTKYSSIYLRYHIYGFHRLLHK